MAKPHHPFATKRGNPYPLGVSPKDQGLNFALFSSHATAVSLCLYLPGSDTLLAEIPFDPKINKTGYIWHICLSELPEKIEYGYQIDGPFYPKKGQLYNRSHLLIDPYAKLLNTSTKFGEEKSWKRVKGQVISSLPFDWEDVSHPQIPFDELVIYEMHVRGFTQHPSSKVNHPGTYLGIIEKIPYLKELGVNAIELLPIHEFNETENVHVNPQSQQKLCNYWGYSSVNFFSPMKRYSSSNDWGSAIQEFKTMVKELHRNQIEVILDVVFNHTAEGNEKGACLSFRGIDNSVYYLLSPDGRYLDFTGCGNTVNCNNMVVRDLIINVLRYWVSEMHVDGFRFDLASIFCRGDKGNILQISPVIKGISEDSILADTKLIAEPWDSAGLYQVGSFPSYQKWAEWNGKYRDDVRRFIKGTDNQVGLFANRLAGSEDLYGHDRKPYHSINFVTAHDGFTLKDLVSYQQKQNEENGEDNRDGMNENDSWNCGLEGETDDPKIIQLRNQQIRNFYLALMVSLGTPMILMGDEYGHSRKGNNNAYCHDNELNWFLWDELQKSKDLFRFIRLLISFRRNHPILRQSNFLTTEEVDWHGTTPFNPDWSARSRFIAYTLKDGNNGSDLYIAFNAQFVPVRIELPSPRNNKKWKCIVDTSLTPPDDFNVNPENSPYFEKSYELVAYSALLLKSMET